MRCFDKQVNFRKKWRNYQHRVLAELQQHLDDDHLHIVAAPGSGKTILGLEVVLRLNKPAVIFAPTLTIRDQWAQRFTSLFCPEDYDAKRIISTDIREPNLLTLSTYQGLHSAYEGTTGLLSPGEQQSNENNAKRSGQPNRKKIIQQLKSVGIKTIVLDEAHHLRNEWWKCLLDLKHHLDKPTIIALTATPPFDVQLLQWERYYQMCGPIDCEIAVPELVKQKDLCPHQDYVYFSSLNAIEQQTFDLFHKNVHELSERICKDDLFAQTLVAHPYVSDPENHIEQVLDDPAFFSSIVVFAWHARRLHLRNLTNILGTIAKSIPEMNYPWMEILLTGCLYRHEYIFENQKPVLKEMYARLKRVGALERKTVQLRSTETTRKLLSSSISKLDSICDIVSIENRSLGDDLRMVILADYIRTCDLPKGPDDTKTLRRLGVVPIFEKLRRNMPDTKLGVLSGKIVVIPEEAIKPFRQITPQGEQIRITPLACDDRYAVIDLNGKTAGTIVTAVTHLFNVGKIKVLTGTKSLLGEGWDAPSINSLILASTVGSHMLSNQMRGRAIRTDERNPEKTANIWHLVCTEENADEFSDDYMMLCRRFKAYAGISFTDNLIQNGIDRLAIGKPPFSISKIHSINKKMTALASDRDGVRKRWHTAFALNDQAGMVQEIRSHGAFMPRNLVITRTLKALLYEGLFWAGWVFSHFRFLRNTENLHTLLALLSIAFGLSALAALPFCLKALYLFLRHGPIETAMYQVGKVILESLVNTGDIKTAKSKMRIKTTKQENGFVSCTLSGATTHESSVFLDAMEEFIDPMNNPRYVLVRRSGFFGLRRKDYHAVPAAIGRRKETAEYFLAKWKKYLGSAELLYTRSIEGRRALVKARGLSMSTGLQPRTERISCWK